MAARKSKGKSNFNTQFVRVNMTSEDKKAFVPWRKDAQKDVDNLINTVLGDGHKLSFSFSEHNDSYIFSITGKPEGCVNADKCFTSHGKDWQTAMFAGLYKYFVIFKGEPWEDIDDEADFG